MKREEFLDFIEVSDVSFSHIKSNDESSGWAKISSVIDLDGYCTGGYSYKFNVDSSALKDNCARVELEYSWPVDHLGIHSEQAIPFSDVLESIKGKYIKWSGRARGEYASGLFCCKDVKKGLMIGIGRITITGGGSSFLRTVSGQYETLPCKDKNGNHTGKRYSRRDFIIDIIDSEDKDLDEAKEEWQRSQGGARGHLQGRLIKWLEFQQLYPKGPMVLPPMEKEFLMLQSARATFETIDYLIDIDSYSWRESPCVDFKSNRDVFKKFIKEHLKGYLKEINDYTDQSRERGEKHYPLELEPHRLTKTFYTMKHTLLPYIDEKDFEYVFSNQPWPPYFIVDSGGRKQFIQSLPLLQSHVKNMIESYFALPYGMCKDDWTADEKNRDKALERFITYFRDQAPTAALVPREDG